MARPPWTDDQLALLGTMTDAAVAAAVGKSRSSVVAMRKNF